VRLSDLKVNSQKRNEGDWVDLKDLGMAFHVRGSGTPQWMQVQRDEARRIRIDERVNGALSVEQERRVEIACVLQVGLLGWRGLKDDVGKEVPYSLEAAETLLRDPDYEPLLALILSACASVGQRTEEEREDAAGN
jgi:hypothetical protein